MNPEQLFDNRYFPEDEDYEVQLYAIAIRSGSILQGKLNENQITPDDLDQQDMLALHTHQFYEHWGDWRLKDIPFMRIQFPWLLDDEL